LWFRRGYTYAKERLKLILPIAFFVIFILLYMVFHSVVEAAVPRNIKKR